MLIPLKSFYKIALLLIVFACSAVSTFSQYTAGGRILDSVNAKPLAFVNIIFNNDQNKGTTTDIDGKFHFQLDEKIYSLQCSYVGYTTRQVIIDESKTDNTNLVISLAPSNLELQEIIISPEENPANRIIRKVIENKKINDPENIPSFAYTFYNKLVYDYIFPDTTAQDTISARPNSIIRDGYLGIMESVTSGIFKRPARYQETITGVKVSGFKHPSFAPLATDIQPFSFYNNIIKILDVYYLNPIADGALNKYQFLLEDTIYDDADTIFILSFKPLPDKNFQSLQGLLYINTNLYAIQNVIAEPHEAGLVYAKIQQQYSFANNTHWFPVQLSYEMTYLKVVAGENGMFIRGKSYIKSVNLDTLLTSGDFSADAVLMDTQASERDDGFWKFNRTDSLTTAEKNTYHVIDSFGEKYAFDEKLNILEKLSGGKIQVDFIDIDLAKVISFNTYEVCRAGFGFTTNDKISRYFSIGAFAGYGIKDQDWKYGGNLTIKPGKYEEFFFRTGYERTLREPGKTLIESFPHPFYNYRNVIGFNMDAIQKKYIESNFRAFRFGVFNVAFNNTTVSPQYKYIFTPEDSFQVHYITSDITVKLRYAYGEKLISSYNKRTSLGTKYPVLYLSFTRGLNDLLQSEFEYNKAELSIEQSFFSKNAGLTKYRINAGMVDRSIPYGLLFTGQGSYDKNFSFIFNNYFQTARPYEFLSDTYAALFMTHNFGSLLFQTAKFKPDVILHHNMGFGTLRNPALHTFTDFRTMEKGFYESGLQINNIIKINYSNFIYLGLGAAVFYRYGAYAYDTIKDNFVFKIAITASTK